MNTDLNGWNGTGMSDLVKIIECPRDAWQGLPKNMPAEIKADYLRTLIAAGFMHIDAVSFVGRAAVPQMADSELVLEYLDPPDDVEIIGIVLNAKGAERAVKTGAVQTVGFPYSVSETFLKRNANQTPEDSVAALEQVSEVVEKAGIDLIGYVSMAFGNPYGDAWSTEEVVVACELLIESGAKAVSLADTVGLATAEEVGAVVDAVMRAHAGFEIGVHLHARPEGAAEKVRAAYEAGCRRFDVAIGGTGGCPFAQDALVGNLATEVLLAELRRLGAELPELRPLDGLVRANAVIVERYGARVQ
jgi:hydroxymethylglutaryl-CoA lyase